MKGAMLPGEEEFEKKKVARSCWTHAYVGAGDGTGRGDQVHDIVLCPRRRGRRGRLTCLNP
jgi:hypothetical protein